MNLCVAAEGVEWQGGEHGAVLGQACTDLLQGDWQLLEHSVRLAEHVQPLERGGGGNNITDISRSIQTFGVSV